MTRRLLYRVRPNIAYANFRRPRGIDNLVYANALAAMREVMIQAMRDAVNDAEASSTLGSRRFNIGKGRSGRRKVFDEIRRGTKIFGGRRTFKDLRAEIYAPEWVAIHETGGVIVPTGGRKYMTLPMPAALRSDGRTKRTGVASWARSGYKLFVHKSRSGNKFIVFKHPTTKKLVFLYLLVDRVTMSRRIFLYEAITSKEYSVVAQWNQIILEALSTVDFAGIVFDGVKVN